jgi:hypothetical protein
LVNRFVERMNLAIERLDRVSHGQRRIVPRAPRQNRANQATGDHGTKGFLRYGHGWDGIGQELFLAYQ